MITKTMRATAAMLASVGVLAACGTDTESSDGGTAAEKVTVVASTNVYGDIAKKVGGDDVEVESLVTQPGQDPHSFEVRPKNALVVSKADVVIENGGGYDDYMQQLLETADVDPVVINAVDVSGRTAPEGEELNEHIWYDFPGVQKLADDIAVQLGQLDKDNAADFTARATAFRAEVQKLIDREAQIKDASEGTAIAVTEPVPLYLTEASGLVNKTPSEFSEAIEEGDDVSATVLDETLNLFADKSVSALLYNEQTSGPITEKVRTAAEKAGVPVVSVTETLPDGMDYLAWMTKNLEDVEAAVKQG